MTGILKKTSALFLVLALTITSVSGCMEKASARVTVKDGKFWVDEKELWLNGCNTPWYNWNEFNGGMNAEAWENTFAQLAEDNINCTRIWVNCDGQSIVRLDSDGEIYNIAEGHWTDLDALFGLAEKYGVYVMATLLSFDHFKSPNWRAMLESKEACDIYAEKYVAEFCDRYGENEYLFSVDIVNEPDWIHENEECGQFDWDNISYLIGRCAATIHERCDTLVTAGIGIIKYNSDKYEGNKVSDEYLKELTGLDTAYLDFYSTHYYDWMRGSFGTPFDKSPEDFGLDADKPCVIGETSNDSPRGMTLPEKYRSLYDNGWEGMLVWMQSDTSNTEMVWYRYDLTKEAANDMAEYVFDKVYPIGKKDIKK